MKIIVRIPVKAGRESAIPNNFARRINAILENAFLEEIDDGLIDIRVSVTDVKTRKSRTRK